MDVARLQVGHQDILVDPALHGPQPDGVEHAAEEGLAAHYGGNHVIGMKLTDPGFGHGVGLKEAGVVARDPEDRVPDAAMPRDRLHSAIGIRSAVGPLTGVSRQ